MQTGATLSSYFDVKVNAAYTGYLDNTKKNRLFKDALISLTERIYRSDYDIKEWDEITYVTRTNVAYTPTSNILNTSVLQVVLVTIGSATAFVITTGLPHGLITGQSVTIRGVAGSLTMNTANTTTTVTVISATTFSITVGSATGTYTANTGTVVTPSTISDYWHLLAIKTLFNTPIYNLNVENASNRSPILVTLSKRSIIRTGSIINISGVLGNTAANGTWYARVMNDFSILLYSDSNLQTPSVGNGLYTKGGTVSIVNDTIASAYTSTMKQGVLNLPTPQDPRFEIADNKIKIYPLDQPCSSVSLDYIRVPSVVIDVTDAVTDLTLYYPEKYLIAVINEAATMYAIMKRDMELLQVSSNEQQKNP